MKTQAVFDAPVRVREFVAAGLWGGERQCVADSTAIGFADSQTGALIAGVVYHDWKPAHGIIDITSYASRRDWLTRQHVRLICGYPFLQLDCRAIIARVSAFNLRTLRICAAIGAEITEIPDLRGDGENECVAVLKREEWAQSRFMRERKG